MPFLSETFMTETADEARRRLVLAALILPVLCAAPVVPALSARAAEPEAPDEEEDDEEPREDQDDEEESEEGPLHDDADEDSDVNHGFDERAGDRGDDRSDRAGAWH